MQRPDLYWMIGGGIAVLCASSLLTQVGVMSPFVPMPLHLVLMAWILSHGFIAVMPTFYVLEHWLLSSKRYFGKLVLVFAIFFTALNSFYMANAWDYGNKYQGEFHTRIVAIENMVGFAALLVIAFFGVNRNSVVLQKSANLLLFMLLSWCAFPYLGEMP